MIIQIHLHPSQGANVYWEGGISGTNYDREINGQQITIGVIQLQIGQCQQKPLLQLVLFQLKSERTRQLG